MITVEFLAEEMELVAVAVKRLQHRTSDDRAMISHVNSVSWELLDRIGRLEKFVACVARDLEMGGGRQGSKYLAYNIDNAPHLELTSAKDDDE